MNIEDAIKAREALEHDIEKALGEFTTATGLRVNAIDIRYIDMHTVVSRKYAYAISIEVKL